MFLRIVTKVLLVLFCAVILALCLRGLPGNPTSQDLNNTIWKDNGPLELSPERGRFALTYSLIEDKSLIFSLPIARFATPDLGYKNGNYVSLFAPGVSFLVAPGYLVGKYFDASQVGTYAVISIFAVINVLLIRAIALHLGAKPTQATIGAITFLFASPAFVYAVSLFQHHISTFLILSSLYLVLRYNNFFSLSVIWLLFAASIPVDYPNLILMLPIAIAALGKIIIVKKDKTKIAIDVRLLRFLTGIGVILPLLFFMWFNKTSYDKPFQLAGTVANVKEINAQGKPTSPKQVGTAKVEDVVKKENENRSAINFFKTRKITNGLLTHFVNKDRGILWYTPVMLFALFGIFGLYKKNQGGLAIIAGVIGFNILLYSMWGDPYGGWAFGSRYLIPSYALCGVLIGMALTYWRKNVFALSLFLLLFAYSTSINTLGALTSSRNPPIPEILALEKLTKQEEKYGYDRNWQFLQISGTKSYLYIHSLYKYIDVLSYYYLINGSIITFGVVLIILQSVQTRKEILREV